MVVFVQIFNQRWNVLDLDEHQNCLGVDIKRRICETMGICEDEIYLTQNGCILENESKLSSNLNDIFVQCHLRLPGGKGGFGSMLRAIGAQIEKTTNREACRDLSGRRMRDVNDEKKIADWLSKQAERDQEKARRKQERLERLQTAPKHVFEDSTKYTSQLQENMDSIDDALQKGLKSSTSGQSSSNLGKRNFKDRKGKKSHKKRKLWHDIDDELSDDSGEESDNKSSCSSMADSDYSVSESSGKGSSTTTTKDLSSGNTSENENTDSHTSPCGESSAHASGASLINTETTFDSHKQQELQNQIDSKNCEQLLEKVAEKQEPKLQDAKSSENTANSDDSSSSNSPSSAAVIEKKRDDSGKQKEELSSEQRENVQDKISSNAVTLPLNLDEYNSTGELEALGLEVLKSALMFLGLKCGGTLQQRAERLFSIKGIPREKIEPSLFAKQSEKKERKR